MKYIFSFIIVLGFISVMSAGPWPQARGNSYLKFYKYFINYNQHYTDQGLIDPNQTTGIYNTAIYGEYGITDRFTLQFNANIFSRNIMNDIVSGTTGETIVEGEALNSVGDIYVAFRYGLNRPGSSWPVALTILFGIPAGSTGQGSQGTLQTGDGEFNQMVRLDVGKSFKWSKNANGYFQAYTGLNNRTNEFSEEFHWGVELGAEMGPLWLITRINAVESLKNGTPSAFSNNASIFANNTEFISPAIELAYYISPQFGISASVGGAVRGEITAAAPAYSFGIFWDRSR